MNFYDELRRIGYNKPKLSKEQKRELISDNTYLFFRKYMLEVLPNIMKRRMALGDNVLYLAFDYKKVADGIYTLTCANTHMIFENISLGELNLYFEAIPNLSTRLANGRYTVSGDIKTFIDYYYEELQREEHFKR